MAKRSEVQVLIDNLTADRDRIDALLTMLKTTAAKAPKRTRKPSRAVTQTDVFEKAAK